MCIQNITGQALFCLSKLYLLFTIRENLVAVRKMFKKESLPCMLLDDFLMVFLLLVNFRDDQTILPSFGPTISQTTLCHKSLHRFFTTAQSSLNASSSRLSLGYRQEYQRHLKSFIVSLQPLKKNLTCSLREQLVIHYSLLYWKLIGYHTNCKRYHDTYSL